MPHTDKPTLFSPLAHDLAKMSTITDDFQHLVSNFAAHTPSSLAAETPIKIAAMASPSESQYLETESPTPLRRGTNPLLHLQKSNATLRPPSSPLKISPLRLAMHNNIHRRQFQEATAGDGAPREYFASSNDGQEVMDDSDSEYEDEESPDLPKTTVTEPTPRAGMSLPNMPHPITHGSQPLDLPPLDLNDIQTLTKGSMVSSVSTLTPSEDGIPRSSFDFTGEYAQLNENGCRQSFLEEMDRVGLLDISADLTQVTVKEKSPPASKVNKRCSLNRDFKFGKAPPPPMPPSNTEAAHATRRDMGTSFQFRTSKHMQDESVFSIASMSSLGRVVDTGIAANFVNIFEREHHGGGGGGSSSDQRRKPRDQLHTAHKSWTDSLRSSVNKTNSSISSIDLVDSALAPARQSHRRKNSSVDSAHSAVRRIGRPGLDSDRMFQTNCLYSIQGSPANSQASPRVSQAPARPTQRRHARGNSSMATKVFSNAPDYRPPTIFAPDSLLDTSMESHGNVDDSMFPAADGKPQFSLFGPKPLAGGDAHDDDEQECQPSPLARKSMERLRRPRPDVKPVSSDLTRGGSMPQSDATLIESVGDDSESKS